MLCVVPMLHANAPPSFALIMNASRCHSLRAIGMFALLAAPLFLTQCSMPSRQAWQYIQSHGLLTYWQYESQHASPPFRTGVSRNTQRYATNTRNSLTVPRYSYRPSSSWSSFWGYDRTPYYSQNRYYNRTPSPSRSSDYDSRPSRPRSSTPAPSTRIPVDEPSPDSPQIVKNDPPVPVNPNPPKSGVAAADLPYGTPVPGRANMVNSPYAGKTQLVDVSGMGAGQTVKCPYTGKLFKVPSAQQAENKAAPRQELKIEPQNLSSEPKTGDKKP